MLPSLSETGVSTVAVTIVITIHDDGIVTINSPLQKEGTDPVDTMKQVLQMVIDQVLSDPSVVVIDPNETKRAARDR